MSRIRLSMTLVSILWDLSRGRAGASHSSQVPIPSILRNADVCLNAGIPKIFLLI